jgi:hypothetical protein
MSVTFIIAGWTMKLIIACVSALIGSVFGRHWERSRVIRERAEWLGYDIPCDAFDQDHLEPGHSEGSRNPLCVRCGFRFSSHDSDVRRMHESYGKGSSPSASPNASAGAPGNGAIPNKKQRNGTPVEGIPIHSDTETTPLEIPSSRKERG